MMNATVRGIMRPAPDSVVNIELQGGYLQNVRCAHGMMAPQVGDVVGVDMQGSTPVVMTVPPDRTWTPWPTLKIVTTPSPGFEQIGTSWSDGNDLECAYSTPPDPPPAGSGTIAVRATGSRTWDPLNHWRSDDTRVRQGSFGSGENDGLWFYGQPDGSNPWTVLTGKTIDRVRLTVTRYSEGGTLSARMQLRIVSHPYLSQPTTQPAIAFVAAPADAMLSRGEPGTFDLPVSVGAALASGAAAGVGLGGSGSTSDYLICTGPADVADSGLLAIDYH